MKRYDKLVRDRIPEICAADGCVAQTRVLADDDEYMAALVAKLHEETDEIGEDPSLGELADALEVIRAIAALKGFTPEQVEAARAQKAAARGGFGARIFLESTEP